MRIREISFGLFLAILLVCSVLSGGCRHLPEFPEAMNGTIDLRQWDFKKNGVVNLSGQWAFYWNRMISPEHFLKGKGLPDPGHIIVPGSWNGFLENGKPIKGEGFATYRLKILIPRIKDPLALKFLDMGTAFNIYVNGKLVAVSGVPGRTGEKSIPLYHPGIATLENADKQIDIVVQVSNFHHRLGGVWEPMLLGRAEDIDWVRDKRLILDFFLLGAILIIGLYHLVLFWSLKQNQSALYFSLFNFMIVIRLMTTGERYLVQFWDGLSFEILLKIIYLSLYAGLAFFAHYMKSIFPREVSGKIVNFTTFFGAGLCLLVILTPARIFSYSISIFYPILIGVLTYGVWAISLAVFRRRQGARVFLGGFLIFFICVVNDVLYNHQIVPTGHFVPLGLFFFIFAQAYLLSQRFAQTILTIEKQWQELDLANKAYQDELKTRIQVQAELKKSEAHYRQLIENSADGICIVTDGNIQYANPRFLSMSGMEPREMGLLSFLNFVYPGDRKKIIESYEATMSGKKRLGYFFVRGQDKTGRVYDLGLNSSRIDWEKKPALMTFVRDMTEQTQTRELLFQSEKMLSVGGLAAGMAHEINNPLAGMMQNAQVAVNRLSPGISANEKTAREVGTTMSTIEAYAQKRNVHRYLTNIVSAGQSAADIVENMLNFARKGPTEKEICFLENIVDKTLALMKNDFVLNDKYDFKNIVIIKDYESKEMPVLCGESKISQVLLNLFRNAVQAMRDSTGDTSNPRITIRLFQENKMACMAVKDNGPGMDVSVRKHIFEPFFTTKQPQKGTGLGLSVSYFIITEDHRGQMEVSSEIDKGSQFIIRLPLA